MATARNLGHRPSIQVGAAEIRPATCEVVGPGGREAVEPRVMQVLVALAEARGETLTRDDLIRLCWNGRVVGDDSINRAILKIRKLADGAAAGSFTLKTIHKVGYRLCETGGEAAPSQDEPAPATDRPPRRMRRGWIAAIVVSALAMLAVVLVWFATPQRPAPEAAAPASLAVLPFRNWSSGDDYFAQGVAEEIRAHLAREPRLRIASRAVSTRFEGASDMAALGRRLDIAYLLEGSVRADGDKVRVQVALARTQDGMQLWSHTYDGRLDDIFRIQQQIGEATADALRLRLARPAALTGPLVTRGDVYTLYLTARELMRSREPAKLGVARGLLERAVGIDPGYAPAWSSLGIANGLFPDQGLPPERAKVQAIVQLRRALALAPDLAEAHAGLGAVLGYDTPEAIAHLKRAVELDPRNAEAQYWLGNSYRGQTDFAGALAAYARAAEIDPLWHRASWHAAEGAWELGDPGAAAKVLQRMASLGDAGATETVRIHYIISTGDYSEAVRRFSVARAAGGATDGALRYRIEEVLRVLAYPGHDGIEPGMEKLRRGVPPSRDELRAAKASRQAALFNRIYTDVAAKMLLNAGRGAELIALFDGESGLIGLPPRGVSASPSDLVEAGPTAALVLRAVGREAEADRLLDAGDRVLRAAMARGRVPGGFLAEGAKLWAVRGERDRALDALERAVAAGWLNFNETALPDLADEPAFRTLRGDPRFERARARIAAHREKERREIGPVPL